MMLLYCVGDFVLPVLGKKMVYFAIKFCQITKKTVDKNSKPQNLLCYYVATAFQFLETSIVDR